MIGALHLVIQRLFQVQDARLRVDAERVVHVARPDAEDDFAVDAQVGVRRLERDQFRADGQRFHGRHFGSAVHKLGRIVVFVQHVDHHRRRGAQSGRSGVACTDRQSVSRRPFPVQRPVENNLSAGLVDAELVIAVAFADVIEDAAVELVVGVGGHDAEDQSVDRRPFRHLRPVRQPREDGRVVVDVQNVDVDSGPVAQTDDAVVRHDGLQDDVILSGGLQEPLPVKVARRLDESAFGVDGELGLRRAGRNGEGQLGVASDVAVGGGQPADVRVRRFVLRDVKGERLVAEFRRVVVLVDDVDGDGHGRRPGDGRPWPPK